MTDTLTPELRITMTRATMHVLDSWKLRGEEMCGILGMPEGTRPRSLQQYRNQACFPDNPELDRRADFILRIAGALRTSYPANPEMGGRWLRQRHRRMERSPIATMVEDGEKGLITVLAELDATFCWDLSGSTRK